LSGGQAPRRRMSLRNALAASVVLALTTAGCSLLPQAQEAEMLELIEPPAISEKPVYTVARVTIEKKVTAAGKLLADPQEELSFAEEGRRVEKVYVKSGDTVRKGQTIAELKTDDLELQALRKDIDVRKKELEILNLLRDEDGTASAQSERSVAARELELLRTELRQLEERLAGSKIVAPFDGTVTSLSVKVGDTAIAYETVAVVSDLNGVIAAAAFASADAAALSVGMEAVVDVNGFGTLKGRIVRLPIEGSASGGALTLDGAVLVKLEGLPDGAAVGTPLTISVPVQRRENAVAVPPAALRTHAGRTYVQTVDDAGNKREVDVEVGLTTATEVEILKGLEPGMRVVGR